MTSQTLLFCNDDAVHPNNLFLNDDYSISKIGKKIHNIYKIKVGEKEIDWIIKKYDTYRHAKKEETILNRLKRVPNVPKLLPGVPTLHINCLIISRCPGMDLFDYTNRYGNFTEESVRPIVNKLLTILVAIHAQNVIHYDIKPENIIYDKDSKEVSLIDFECKHTKEYRSPEQIRGECITSKTDLFSLGITVFYLITGKHPFSNKKEVLKNDPKYPKRWSILFQEFMGLLLEKDATLRIDAKSALKHDWLRE